MPRPTKKAQGGFSETGIVTGIEGPLVPNDQIEGETDFAGWCQMVERCKCSERLQNEGESKLCVSARQIEEWMEWEQLCKMVPLLPPFFPSFPSDAGSHHSLASQQPHYIDHGSFGDYSFYLIMSICNVHARSHLHIDRSLIIRLHILSEFESKLSLSSASRQLELHQIFWRSS